MTTLKPTSSLQREVPRTSRRVQVSVPVSSLSHTNNNGLLKRSILHRLLSWKKKVTVEGTPHDRSDSVFYAPFPDVRNGHSSQSPGHPPSKTRPCETDFLTVDPHNDVVQHLVSIEDEFELAFVGMHIPPFDTTPVNPNELLLYSLHKQIFPDDESAVSEPHSMSSVSGAEHKQEEEEEDNGPVLDPNGISLQANDVPYIHYDPTTDNHGDGSVPDTFVPIPASKGVIKQHRANSPSSIIPIRFSIMEIDKVTSEQAQGLAKVDQMNGVLKQASAAMPYIGILSSAITVANTVGKYALKKYAEPDHVLTKDMEFHLVSRSVAAEAGVADRPPRTPNVDLNSAPLYAGTYLRYGFYFFLCENVDAKLYAQTDASSQNVPLLLRREGYDSIMAMKGEKEFFPLTGIGYVVMKVSPGMTHQPRAKTKVLAVENRKRLENILHIGKALELLAGKK